MAYKDKNDERAKESRRKWYKENKQKQLNVQKIRVDWNRRLIQKYKSIFLKCSDCGLSFRNKPYLCDFHHLYPNNKVGVIGQMMTYGIKSLRNEISKCIPLCSNCHRERHNNY